MYRKSILVFVLVAASFALLSCGSGQLLGSKPTPTQEDLVIKAVEAYVSSSGLQLAVLAVSQVGSGKVTKTEAGTIAPSVKSINQDEAYVQFIAESVGSVCVRVLHQGEQWKVDTEHVAYKPRECSASILAPTPIPTPTKTPIPSPTPAPAGSTIDILGGVAMSVKGVNWDAWKWVHLASNMNTPPPTGSVNIQIWVAITNTLMTPVSFDTMKFALRDEQGGTYSEWCGPAILGELRGEALPSDGIQLAPGKSRSGNICIQAPVGLNRVFLLYANQNLGEGDSTVSVELPRPIPVPTPAPVGDQVLAENGLALKVASVEWHLHESKYVDLPNCIELSATNHSDAPITVYEFDLAVWDSELRENNLSIWCERQCNMPKPLFEYRKDDSATYAPFVLASGETRTGQICVHLRRVDGDYVLSYQQSIYRPGASLVLPRN